MSDLKWIAFVEKVCEAEGLVFSEVVERLRADDDYHLAYVTSKEGASDRVLRMLLQRALGKMKGADSAESA